MKKLRTLLCTSALVLVPLAAGPVAAHDGDHDKDKKKDSDPVTQIVCSVDSAQEGCATEEPTPHA